MEGIEEGTTASRSGAKSGVLVALEGASRKVAVRFVLVGSADSRFGFRAIEGEQRAQKSCGCSRAEAWRERQAALDGSRLFGCLKEVDPSGEASRG